MTTIDEANDYTKYEKLQFVELLEMIGRIADLKYYGTDAHDKPLATKIGLVLDIMLEMVGCQRRDVKKKIESDSESDNDY